MMAGPAFVSGFAAMGDAFLKSYQAESDRLRRRAAEEAETAWQNELRGKKREEWGREDAVRRAYERAMSTPEPSVELTPQASKAAGGIAVGDQGGAVANAGAALRGYPGADSPTPAANSGWHNKMMRVSDAIAHLDPKQAMEIRDSAMRSRSTELGLKKAERDEINEHYNNMLVGALNSAPTWYEGAVNFAKEVMGANVVYELSEDGKRVSLYGIEADGKRKLTGTYKADGSGALEFLDKALKQDAKTMVAMLRANMEYERARADKAEDREAEQAGREKIAMIQRGSRESGSPSREERLRYSALFSEAGRRMSEATKTMNTLLRDRDFMRKAGKPGSGEAQQLADLRAEIEGYRSERATYQQYLADSAAASAPRSSVAESYPGMTNQERESDRRAILESELARARALGRMEDAAALEREISRLPGGRSTTAPARSMGGATGQWSEPGDAKLQNGAATGRSIARGQVVNGYEFLGGDPKSSKSWRQVSSGKVN